MKALLIALLLCVGCDCPPPQFDDGEHVRVGTTKIYGQVLNSFCDSRGEQRYCVRFATPSDPHVTVCNVYEFELEHIDE